MAASASFKQQCPSCEAMVPIKDLSFIGRKIDCPKCKYRFVVEDPADEDEGDEEEAKPAKKGKGATGVTAKKPANGKAAAKAAPGKKKPGVRARADDDEDDDGEGPAKKKKKGGSTTLILGIGLAAVAVLVLGGGAVYFFTSNSSSGGGGGGGGITRGPGGGTAAPGAGGGEENPVVQQAKPAAPALGDITNLLPNDTEVVRSVNVDRLINSAAGKAAFETAGGFHPDSFQKGMGFPIADVNRVVWAAKHPGLPDLSQFAVIRTTKPQTIEALTRNLKLVRDAKNSVEGFDCYTVGEELDSLSRFLLTDGRAKEPLSFHLYDEQTLVFASPDAMKAFLSAKRQPKVLAQAEGGGNASGGQGAPMGGGSGPPAGQGSGPMGMPAGSGSGPMAMPAGSGSGPMAGMSGGSGSMPATAGGSGPMMQGQGGAQQAAAPTASYSTIKPALKAILDEIEDCKPPAILSLVTDMQASVNFLKQHDLPKEFGDVRTFEKNTQGIEAVGLALQDLTTTRLAAVYAIGMKKDDDARKARDVLRLAAPLLVKALHTDMDLDIGLKGDENARQTGTMQPGGSGGSGMAMPMGSGSGMAGMSGGSGRMGMPMGSGSGMMPPRGGGSGQPGAEGGQEESKDEHTSTLAIQAKEKVLLLAFDLSFKDNVPAYEKVMRQAELLVLQDKGTVDMDGRSHVHDLAAALKGYADKNGQFPRGTAERPALERAGMPWRPDQRVSWMADIVPFLGQGEYAGVVERVQRDKSWTEDENLRIAQTLIPHFLPPDYAPTTWWGLYPGAPLPTANTLFVGVAGVGDDAADYSASDPAVAKKLGIFGYDRATRVADIKDGPDKTIALLQVPPDYKTPWLAGGGSTVRGVPETKSVQPFVCTTYDGKRGTFAVMADGKVRFIPETIDDKDFQALCTIAGGEKVDVDKVAPEVPAGERGAVLKTEALPPVAPATPTTPTTAPTTGDKSGASGNKPPASGTAPNSGLTPEQKKATEQEVKREEKALQQQQKAAADEAKREDKAAKELERDLEKKKRR